MHKFASRLRIIYEDESVLVVDKPAGLLTIATETERAKTLYAMARAYLNGKKPQEKVFIVHRLDREASGLLVFAKTMKAKEQLQEQFKSHRAGRVYIAVVEGNVQPNAFTIRSLLAENKAFRVYVTEDARVGKPAVTHVRVLRRKGKTSELEVRLETGRKHQIRIHLAERGHPIVGDKFYGSKLNSLGRLGLRGTRLEFDHPVTRKRMAFELQEVGIVRPG